MSKKNKQADALISAQQVRIAELRVAVAKAVKATATARIALLTQQHKLAEIRAVREALTSLE